MLVGPAESQSAELYDPSTGTWKATGSLAFRRSGGYSATLLPDGTVLVLGGFGRLAELYDPSTRTWAAAPDVGSPSGGTTTLLADGTVLVAGDGSASAVLYKPGRAD